MNIFAAFATVDKCFVLLSYYYCSLSSISSCIFTASLQIININNHELKLFRLVCTFLEK